MAHQWNSDGTREVMENGEDAGEHRWLDSEVEMFDGVYALMTAKGGALLDHNYSRDSGEIDMMDIAKFEHVSERSANELLQSAVISKNVHGVVHAVHMGGDVNVCMDGFNHIVTPVMLAAKQDDDILVNALIKMGANVNIVNVEGRNALMIAAPVASYEVVRLLLEAGSDVNARDINGQTALMAACDNYHMICDCMQCVSRVPRRYVANQILAAGADVLAVDKQQNSALLLACRNAHDEDMVELLLDAGSDVNCVDYAGYSVLMHAVWYNRANVVALLLCRGADISLKSFFGESVADLVSLESERCISIAVTLMRGGVNIEKVKREAGGIVMVEWKKAMKYKLSLSHICREVIRGCVMRGNPGLHVEKLVEKLPLPACIKALVADSERYLLNI